MNHPITRFTVLIERRATLSATSCDDIIDIMKWQKYNTILPLHLQGGEHEITAVRTGQPANNSPLGQWSP